MLTALAVGLTLLQVKTETINPTIPEVTSVLVASLKDRRSDFKSLPKTEKELRALCKARNYEVLNKDSQWLIVDRRIFDGTSELIGARLVDDFASRNFKEIKIGDLPTELRDAVVDSMMRMDTGMSREDVAQKTLRMEAAVFVDVTNPSGLPSRKGTTVFVGNSMFGGSAPLGSTITKGGSLSDEDKPTSSSESASNKMPAEENLAELRIFTLEPRNASGTIALWDELQHFGTNCAP